MINADELLEKTRANRLTQEEFDIVVKMVRDGPYDENLSLLIYVLRLAGAKDLKKIIEKFLYYPTNPYVSRVALKTLCEGWKLTGEYLEEVKRFIVGEEWDVRDEIRLLAISIAGEYLVDHFDKHLLILLLNVFEGHGIAPSSKAFHTRDFVKSCAYDAILRAFGKGWDEIPYYEETEELIRSKRFEELDQKILQKAREIAQSK